MTEVWYRWEGHSSAFMLCKLPVIKTTPRGVWLDNFGRKKFVLNNSHKRFAYPTEEEAEVSFIKRREKQIIILQERLETALKDLRVFKSSSRKDSAWLMEGG